MPVEADAPLVCARVRGFVRDVGRAAVCSVSVRRRPASAKAGVTFDPDKPYMRTLPSAQLKARRQLLDRVVVERAPELHIVGEISGATGFDSGLSCRYVGI